MNFRSSIFLVLFTIFTTSIYSQDRYLGISGGGALYTGDLDPISRLDYLQNVRPAFGVFYRQELSDRFSFKLGLSRVNIRASDEVNLDVLTDPNSSPALRELAIGRLERNFDIKNKITEFSLLAEVKVFSLFGIDFHFTAGPAIYRHNPEGFDNVDMIYRPLQPLATEDQGFDDRYSLFQFAIPFGGFMVFDVNDKISIQVDLIGRYTFTDYLDDIRLGTYVPASSITNPVRQRLSDPFVSLRNMPGSGPSQNPASGIIRGNPDVRDYFGSSSISVLFRMPNLNKEELGCPLPF